MNKFLGLLNKNFLPENIQQNLLCWFFQAFSAASGVFTLKGLRDELNGWLPGNRDLGRSESPAIQGIPGSKYF
jgi:hypothetical protein